MQKPWKVSLTMYDGTKTKQTKKPFWSGFWVKRKKSFLKNLILCVDDSEIPSLEVNVKFMLERRNLWESLAKSNVKQPLGAFHKPKCISFPHINNQTKMRS